MKKTLVALLLALCMVTSLTAATACCVDSGRAETTGMEKPMTMEETCPCMMDGKGVNGCQCNGDKCGKDCMGGVCGDDCMCRVTVVLEHPPRGRKITVIFTEEALGY